MFKNYTLLEKSLILSILILAIFRFTRLTDFPPFGDEVLYLFFADQIITSPSLFLNSIPSGVMPILSWILTPIELATKNIISPLTAGRGYILISDLLSSFLIFLIGKLLFNSKSGFIASIIYLSLPANFLISRMVLLEPLVNLFIITTIYFGINSLTKGHLTKKVNHYWIIISGLLLILGYFTKPIAAVYFPAVFSIPLINLSFFKRRKDLKYIFINFILLLGLTIIALLIFYLPIAHNFQGYIIPLNTPIVEHIAISKANLWRLFWWSDNYFTLPILLAAIISSIMGLYKKSLPILWLTVWIITILILSIYFSAHFYPRHLYPLTAPISLLLGYLLSRVVNKNSALGTFVLVLIIALPLSFNYQLVFNPLNAPLALEDRQQFLEDWTAGVGYLEISTKINKLSSKTPITVYTDNQVNEKWVLENLYKTPNATIITDIKLVNNKTPSYLILNRYPDIPKELKTRLIYSYPKGPNRNISIHEIIQSASSK